MPRSIYLLAACIGVLCVVALAMAHLSRRTLDPPGDLTPVAATPCDTGQFGNPHIGISLSNFPVGTAGYCSGNDNEYSIRFRATSTGQIQALRAYIVNNTDRLGYSAGTGGTANWEFYTDDPIKHIPSTQKIGSMTFALGYTDGRCSGMPGCMFRRELVDSPPQVIAGQLYHLVIRSNGTSPSNFYSLNELYISREAGQGPYYDPLEFNSLRKCDGVWESESWHIESKPSYHIPSMQFEYSDGSVSGSGYMESYAANVKTISQSVTARQVVKSDASRCFDTVSVYVKPTRSSTLTMRIRGPSVDTTATTALTGAGYSWQTVRLPAAILFQSGQTYTVDFSSSDGGFIMSPIRDGGGFGYAHPAVFLGSDAYAQYSDDAGSTYHDWYGYGSVDSFRYGDLSVMFSTRSVSPTPTVTIQPTPSLIPTISDQLTLTPIPSIVLPTPTYALLPLRTLTRNQAAGHRCVTGRLYSARTADRSYMLIRCLQSDSIDTWDQTIYTRLYPGTAQPYRCTDGLLYSARTLTREYMEVRCR